MLTKLTATAGACLLFLFIVIISCKKEVKEKQSTKDEFVYGNPPSGGSDENTCVEATELDWISDTISTETILGRTLINHPYSVPVMQQASINLYGGSHGITANRKYIRYKPATQEQLIALTYWQNNG